jgi:FixJ family two-component response regulator
VFDCLLLDVQLGGLSGIELAERLAREGSRTPFLFITGLEDSEARLRAESAGCAAYYRKTESGTTIIDAIRRLAGR